MGIWFYPDEILSKHRLFNFAVGPRGNGKTTGALDYCVRQKEKNPNFEAVFLRRYDSERRKVRNGLFNAIFNLEKDRGHKIALKQNTYYFDEQPFIHVSALSVDGRTKGITSPNIQLIIFDEFLIDRKISRTNYMAEETEYFLDYYNTIARPTDPNRKRCPVLFLANTLSVINPYFIYFNVSFNEKNYFQTKSIYAEIIKNSEFEEQAKKSEFAQLIKNTDYERYSIEAEFIYDNYDFIEEKTDTAKLMCCANIDGATYGFWVDWKNGRVFMSEKHDPNFPRFYSFTAHDLKPNILTAQFFKKTEEFNILKAAYNTGALYYDKLTTKTNWQKIIRMVGV